MVMFSIAEWVANVLILGIGVFFWVSAFAIIMVVVSVVVDRFTYE